MSYILYNSALYIFGLTCKEVYKCIKMEKMVEFKGLTSSVSWFRLKDTVLNTFFCFVPLVMVFVTHRLSVWPCWSLTSLFTPGPRFTLSELKVDIYFTFVILSKYFFLLGCISTKGLSCQSNLPYRTCTVNI